MLEMLLVAYVGKYRCLTYLSYAALLKLDKLLSLFNQMHNILSALISARLKEFLSLAVHLFGQNVE